MTTRQQGEAARASTRERLIEAAIVVAGAQGQDRVTYRAVAAQAGVAHSLVRFHFGDRETLLAAALHRAAQRDADRAGIVATDLDAFGATLVETISDGQARHLLQFDYLLHAARGRVPRREVIELYDAYISHVAGTLRAVEVADADDTLAALVFAALDGIVLQHALYDSAERTEALLERLRELLRPERVGERTAPPTLAKPGVD